MTEPLETERTTLYLDPEVKRRLQERGRRHRQSMSGAANILLIAAMDEEDRREKRSTIRLEQVGNHDDFYNVYDHATGREIGTVINRGYPKTPWCAIRPEYVAHNPDTAPTYGMARTKEEAAECLLVRETEDTYQVLD